MGTMNASKVTPLADSLSPLLSINQVARLLGISRKTLYALIRRGDLLPIRVGERLRFDQADIRAYLERQREGRAP
jgi:excisionase family DNA binding protein